MFIYTKRSGSPGRFRFLPGCLLWSIVLSIALTLLLNLIIRVL